MNRIIAPLVVFAAGAVGVSGAAFSQQSGGGSGVTFYGVADALFVVSRQWQKIARSMCSDSFRSVLSIRSSIYRTEHEKNVRSWCSLGVRPFLQGSCSILQSSGIVKLRKTSTRNRSLN
jgi:hypothetical protein